MAAGKTLWTGSFVSFLLYVVVGWFICLEGVLSKRISINGVKRESYYLHTLNESIHEEGVLGKRFV